MKKFFGIVLFFSTLMIFGQGQRFVYEYKFKPSKKANDTVRTEFMNLDVFKDYSVYYGQTKFQSDSMSMNTFIEQHKNGDTFFSASGIGGYWNSGDVIHKMKPDNKILWKTNVGENSLEVEDQFLGKWKIESETQTIANYPCQKAELDFGGRKWTAWFTTKIPIQDGPYKFSGLPGLIVSLSDHSGSHNFVLKGANKLENEQQSWEYISTLQKDERSLSSKPIKVSKKQYVKLFNEHLEDPAKDIKQQLNTPGTSITVRVDGKEISDKNGVIKFFEESERKSWLEKDNPIEIDTINKK